MNVLIVDDSPANRTLLDAVLQAEGLSTCEAADGLEALAILKSQPVDAIISDILMPKMDGYRFCFEVRRQERFREIPFIFYSSTYTSPADAKLGLQLGANAFLRKPATGREMLHALSALMTQTHRLPPPRMELPQELTLMKEYSEQLVAKLEEKSAELQQRTRKLQELSRRLLEVQETEKRHLARELHDEIGQVLSVLKLNLEAIQQPSSSERPGEKVSDCIRLVDHVLHQVRGMSLNLRPSILDDLGLVPALRWYVGQHEKRTGLAVALAVPEEERRYDSAVETACFRVAQEALTNILRHARAKRTTITLSETEGALQLRVRDDGAGFDVPAARQRAKDGGSFGIVGMQERVSLLDGHLEFKSKPGHGTEMCARFPLDRSTGAEPALREVQP